MNDKYLPMYIYLKLCCMLAQEDSIFNIHILCTYVRSVILHLKCISSSIKYRLVLSLSLSPILILVNSELELKPKCQVQCLIWMECGMGMEGWNYYWNGNKSTTTTRRQPTVRLIRLGHTRRSLQLSFVVLCFSAFAASHSVLLWIWLYWLPFSKLNSKPKLKLKHVCKWIGLGLITK